VDLKKQTLQIYNYKEIPMTNQLSFKKRVFLLLVCVAAAGLFFSCSMDFFASSWGKDAQRDPVAMTVDAGNVFKVLKNARGDPKASMGVLDKIAEGIHGASPEDQKTLREAALVAAAQATDVAGLVVSSIDTITEALNGGGDVNPETLLESILNNIDLDKAAHAGDSLTSIMLNANGEFVDDFEATDSELLQAAFVIILGEAGSAGSVENYLADWGSTKDFEHPEALLSPNEKVLAGIVNKLVNQSDSPLVDGLKGVMSSSGA
jgi:hypothetical protein